MMRSEDEGTSPDGAASPTGSSDANHNLKLNKENVSQEDFLHLSHVKIESGNRELSLLLPPVQPAATTGGSGPAHSRFLPESANLAHSYSIDQGCPSSVIQRMRYQKSIY